MKHIKSPVLRYLIYSLLPISLFFGLYIANIILQPKVLKLSTVTESNKNEDFNPSKYYYLSGDMECIPHRILAPKLIGDNPSESFTIKSLSEIRQRDCLIGNDYVATVRFFIELPAQYEYAMLFPGELCEYIIYSNRTTTKYSTTFKSDNPVYPSPAVINLPKSDDGRYEIVIYAITPESSSGSTKDTILFGTKDRIEGIRNLGLNTSIVIFSSMSITILFCLIQLLAMRKERLLPSFIFLALALMTRTVFVDDVIIMNYIPHLQYQLGTVIKSLTIPLILLALLYHEYCMFPKYFDKVPSFVVCFAQLIPLLNSLTLRAFPFIDKLTYFVYALPLIYCVIILLKANQDNLPDNELFGLGISQVVAACAAELVCSFMAMGTRYTFIYAFLTFAIVEMVVLARRYAKQKDSEIYYTEELNKTLEAMQASENAFLNAQMKPHFLYNTLNTIADLCVTDPEKAKNLISSLKDYCRLILSIDNMDKTVPLQREMELATAYTNIEKERFPSINFYTDFPIRMPKVNMPPLTLQPLIENAIKHGVRMNDKPGVVTLRIRESFDSITFYVSDNGVGMDEETMGRLFEQPKENKSIGVYNIDKRLKNLYNSGLEVESTINLGTCISFTVPK